METPAVLLRPGRRLVGIRREKASRALGYVVVDRIAGSVVVCAQRLPLAAAYLNTLGNDAVGMLRRRLRPMGFRLQLRKLSG